MNITRKTIIYIFGLLLISCEGETIGIDKAGHDIKVNATIENHKTRVSESVWKAGDAIGIFAKNTNEQLSESSAIVKNVKYVTPSGTNEFAVENKSDLTALSNNNWKADLIGYYPYSATIQGFTFPVDVSDQTDQSAIDLMYSKDATSIESEDPYANMTFVHQLSKIVLNIKSKSEQSLSNISVVLTNCDKKASFDLTNGTLSSYSDKGNINFRINSEGDFAEAIILPTTELSGKGLEIKLGQRSYTYSLAYSEVITKFEKSTRYTYEITLSEQDDISLVEGVIDNWTSGPSEELTLSPSDGEYKDVDNEKGTRENPYSVDEAILNQGKNGVWVKGYIVGYFKSTSKTSFTNVVDPQSTGSISSSNFAISAIKNASNNDIDKILSVQMPSTTKIKNYINLKDNPELYGKEILLRGNLNKYLYTTGIRDITSAVIDGVEYKK